MKTRIAIISVLMIFTLASMANASGKGEIQKFFSKTAQKVQAAENPSDKREILSEAFNNMSITLDKVQNSGLISKEESESIDLFKSAVQEKQDELEGKNGFDRVPDSQLNNFSNYVVQDMEQASVTISIGALILIIILVLVLL